MIVSTLMSLYALAMAMGFVLTIVGAIALAGYGAYTYVKKAINGKT